MVTFKLASIIVLSDWLALNTNEIGLRFNNAKSMSDPPMFINYWSKTKIEKEGYNLDPRGQHDKFLQDFHFVYY